MFDQQDIAVPGVDVGFVHYAGRPVEFGERLGGWRGLTGGQHLIHGFRLGRVGEMCRHPIVQARN